MAIYESYITNSKLLQQKPDNALENTITAVIACLILLKSVVSANCLLLIVTNHTAAGNWRRLHGKAIFRCLCERACVRACMRVCVCVCVLSFVLLLLFGCCLFVALGGGGGMEGLA